ncbi:ABC transporter ATP-binding protein [Cyanobium sp. NIES-981]|uniref:ABC transporter ATP-binding protein n=1 Tax=Cyanobium sp. NIES-981 TaxID=1851505 RepID=UPI0007DE17E7|nr:ABC transporter ATP-binding protein [Cyanobium sp. NIES-981]SBO42024.1 taurine transporter subunit; ATP-binding component of ABC superfamily [Cyanobium sp. NIES-981]
MHLSVDNVSKVFGVGRAAKCVLDGISFEVNTGDFVALVGSSGSGKSTVMRLVAGLERPTTGSITVDGQSVKGPGSDRGMVFQKYSLYPWLTAAQNVAFGMELQGLARREIRERTSYFLDVVGLGDAARRLPRELSGGMQQRVAIARALAAQPKVLLLDEPFGALDLQIRESMQEFLHQLWQRTGLSALLITHDLEEALLLAQRVHIMAPRPGRIVRSVQVDLDHTNMGHLRVSPEFLTLREELAQCLRSLEPALAA